MTMSVSFEEVMFLEQLHRLSDDITAAAGAGRRAASFDAHHAVVAFEHEVFDTKLFGVKVHRLEHVDDGRHQLFRQREGGIVFGVAADLQNAFAELRERNGKVGRRRALADAALAIDREDFRGVDPDTGIKLHLHAAFAVADGGLAARSGPDVRTKASSAAISVPTPSEPVFEFFFQPVAARWDVASSGVQ